MTTETKVVSTVSSSASTMTQPALCTPVCLLFHTACPGSWASLTVVSSGCAGAVDRECWAHSDQQRPHVHAAEDAWWPGPDLLHPADVPLHFREQADGHHRQGTSAAYLSQFFPSFFGLIKAPCLL